MNEKLLMSQEEQRQVNWSYLIPLVATLTFGVSNVGFVIAGNNQVGGILASKLDWDDRQAARWNSTISSAGVLGLIIGSFAVELILRKIGRRKAIILTSLVVILAVIPTIFLSVWSIILGKFFFGLAAGSMIVASSIYMNETVPAEHSSTFGFSINFGVICGIMVCLLMGAALPDPKEDLESAKDNTFWIFINLFPIVISSISIMLWLCCFKLESVKACLTAASVQEGATS